MERVVERVDALIKQVSHLQKNLVPHISAVKAHLIC